jgi:2-oxoglutarate ferredoxin oxidoreductase subunit gamma
MLYESVILSGFGGQGVLFTGQLLAYAGIAENLYVTWIPSYGPEMRGGTANCTVILSEQEIGAPVVRNPNVVLVFNNPSFIKYVLLVKENGLMVVNVSLTESSCDREDIVIENIPASDIATELGNIMMANMVMLGALIHHSPIVSLDTIKQQLEIHLSTRQRKWLEPNKQALDKGYNFHQNTLD